MGSLKDPNAVMSPNAVTSPKTVKISKYPKGYFREISSSFLRNIPTPSVKT